MKRTTTFSVILMLCLFAGQIYAQTAQSKEVILQQTKVTQLKAISASSSKKYQANKKKAIDMAQSKGWIISKQIDNNGAYLELQGVTNDGRPLYYITHNADAAVSTATNKVYSGGALGLDLDGTGMVAGEWDGGDVLTTHQEFNNTGSSRVTDKDGVSSTHYHATHVAGTIIAGGVQTAAKGMAYNASLDAYDWDNDESEMAAAAASGLLVSNHSYGYIAGWYWNGAAWEWVGDTSVSNDEDYQFGFYGSYCVDIDNIANNAPYYLIVKSAGNDQGDWDGSSTLHPKDGGADGYDCIGYKGNAKNILTVGAVEDVVGGYTQPSDVTLTSFSSTGPCDDGRIKPDIVGNGYGVYSTFDTGDSDYQSLNGTSMSSPNVTGSLLLLQEHYYENYSTYMKAATLKALAIHTADECGAAEGPDYKFGWGLLNTAEAANVITNKEVSTFIKEETYDGSTYTFDVDATGTEPLVVTLVWSDPAGTPVPAQLDPTDIMLVNDLDMTVSDGTVHQPYLLDVANPANPATTGNNDVDNVEKIYIATPNTGTYTISITHEGTISGGAQDFSLIVSGITNGSAVVSTLPASNITSTSATIGGNVLNEGESSITDRGVVYGLSPNPTLSDTRIVDAGTGLGSYTADISGLTKNTTYFVRAYAINATDTVYGENTEFKTSHGYPYYESFEAGLGKWVQSTTDDMDWSRRSGTTPSSSTGPDAASDGTYYLYTEASGSNNREFILEADFNFTDLATPALFFDYHMYGSSMGDLSVDVFDGSTWVNNVYQISGEQQTSHSDPWDQAFVDLSSFGGLANVKLRFRGVTGSSYQSDICIDNLEIIQVDPLAYQSTTLTQNTDDVFQGATDKQILGIQIDITGIADTIKITQFDLNTTGTTNTADILNAKIYFTDTSSVFSADSLYGSVVTSPNGTFTITGDRDLLTGTNYFWLTYDVSQTAVPGNLLDAQCTEVVVGEVVRTVSVPDPAGEVTIFESPTLSVTPDTINAFITQCYDSVTHQFTIDNTGGNDLIYNISGTGLSGVSYDFLIIDHGKNKSYFSEYTTQTISETNFSTYTLEQLKDHEVVYFEPGWSNYNNLTANMANLQSYVEQGGVVVLNIAGNIGDAINIDPYGTDYSRSYTSENENINIPDHEYITGAAYGGHLLTAADFDSWGSTDHGGLLNYPPDSEVVLSNSNGDSWIHYKQGIGDFIITTLTYGWVSPQNPHENLIDYSQYLAAMGLPEWINLSSYSDTILPATFQQVDIEFNAKNLYAGVYNSDIIISSNDPMNASDTIHCEFTVQGSPAILTSNKNFDFGDVFIGATEYDTLTIYNEGCDTLFVTDITSSIPEFAVDTTLLNILPDDSAKVSISFSPVSITNYTGTLTIVNNDADSVINLTGSGVNAPILSVTPDTVNALVTQCYDSVTHQLTIENTGGNDLIFDIQGGNSNEVTELLGLTYGVDYGEEFQNTISAINQYYTNYNLTEINTTDPVALETALEGKDVFLVAEQEAGSPGVFTNFASVLHSFVSDGGTVIFCGTSNSNSQHIFNTGLFTGSYFGDANGSLNVLDNTHPITDQLPASIPTQNATYCLDITNADATRLVDYNGSHDAVTYRKINNGKVIFVAYDYYAYDDNAAQIIANAVEWGTIGIPSWLNVSVSSDTIPSGATQQVDIEFNALDLNSGVYSFDIFINSNAPSNAVDTVYCEFTVQGSPSIVTSDKNFDFGDVYAGATKKDTLTIYNEGCDTLFVTDITSSIPEFAVDATLLNVLPDDSAKVSISFSPVSTTNYTGALTIVNNDADSVINLTGSGIASPGLSVTPDAINALVTQCYDSVTHQFTIENTGGNDLFVNIEKAGFDSTSTQYYSTDDATTQHQFVDLMRSDSLFLNITINGDFNSDIEYVDIFVDGTSIGQMNPSVNNTDVTQSFVLGGSDVANWLSDGEIQVTLDNSVQVNTGYGTMLHQVEVIIPGAKWLNLSNTADTILPGALHQFEAKFNAKNLNAGIYNTHILIESNDPLNITDTIHCEFTVQGNPEFLVSKTNLDFGDVYVGDNKTLDLELTNNGCDTLFVSSIISSIAEFTTGVSTVEILPGETYILPVSFNPVDQINYNGTLTIYTNDADSVVSLSGTGVAAGIPLISVSETTLDYGQVEIGNTAEQSYAVSGSNLTNDISITAPAGYEVSLTSGSGFASSLTLTQVGGTVAPTTIYVKFAPTTEQTYTGNIANASTGASQVDVAVSGTGVTPPPPVITVSESTINYGDVEIGNTAEQSYTVSGSNLTNDIDINAPAGYEVSLTSGSGFASSLTLTQTGGTVATTTIYVKFIPTAEQTYTGDIIHTSVGATQVNLALSGTGVVVGTPLISVSEATLDFGDVEVGNTAELNYSVSGTNLTGDITISAPTGFEVSLSSGSGFSGTLTLPQSGGTVAATTVYVKFAPTVEQAYTEDVIHTSSGASQVDLTVTGTGIVLPTPYIIVSEGAISFGEVITGNTVEESYSVSGSDLTDNIEITAPTGFEVSLTSGSGFAGSLTLPQSGGTVTSTTVYVRFAPTNEQFYSGNVSHITTGASQVDLTVTGTGIAPPTPVITVSEPSISFGEVETGNTAEQSYTVSGSDLTNDIELTAPTGFEISLTSGSGFASSLILTQSGGTVATTPVYVRFAPVAEQTYSGNVSHTSSGATQTDVLVSGTGVPVGTPIISLSGGFMNFGSVVIDNTSSVKQYSVSGINLTDDIVITAPGGFEISLDNSDYSVNPIALPQTGGNVSSTTIYARFAPTASGSYSGNISNVSTGATSVNLAVSGNGICANLTITNPDDATRCEGENVTFGVTATGTGPLTYVWKKGTTTLSDDAGITGSTTNTLTISDIVADDAGAYTCEVTDACGNTEVSNAGVLDIPAATVIVTQPTSLSICEGEEAQFTVSATGDGLSYQWKKGAENVGTDSPTYTIASSAVADSDDYTCVVSGTCGTLTTDVATLAVTSNPVVDLGGDQNACEGETVTLDAGAGFTTYLWSTGDETQTVDVATTGIYAVTVANAGGCQGSDQVEVVINANPTVDLGSDQDICEGESLTLNAGAGFDSYVWSTGETTQSIDVSTTGTFAVTVTNAGGCEASDEIAVTVHPNPTVDLGADQSVCEGETVTLDAGEGFETYSWNTGASSQSIDVTTSGTYVVTVTNTGGCEAIDNVEVVVHPNPTVDLGADQNICEGETATLDAGTGFETYTWSTGATAQTIDVTTTDTYAVTVTNAGGCQGVDEVEIVFNPLPSVDLGNDTTIFNVDSILLDAGAGFVEYLWNNGSNNQTLLVEGPVLDTIAHEFSVTVTDDNYCSNSDTIVITINNYIGIFETGTASNTINVYPVPARDRLNFNTDLNIQKVMVYDYQGQLVISKKNINNNLDVSVLEEGTYILKLIDSRNRIYNTMFIKSENR